MARGCVFVQKQSSTCWCAVMMVTVSLPLSLSLSLCVSLWRPQKAPRRRPAQFLIDLYTACHGQEEDL